MSSTSSPNTVVVVGMGLAAPGVNGPQDFWRVLREQVNTLHESGDIDVTNWYAADRSVPDKTYVRTTGYLHSFFPHRRLAEERAMGYWAGADRTMLLLRHSLLQAMDTAAVPSQYRCGAYVGAQPGGRALEEAILLATAAGSHRSQVYEQLRARYPHAPEQPADAFPDRMLRMACEDLLPGDSDLLVIDTACSSSLYAIDFGVKALLAGERDVVFCGGANTGSRRDLVLFAKLHGLSANGEIRAFDADAAGVLFSDAAAIVALKLLDRALADGDEILGLLGGFGGSADGEGSVVASSPVGQRLALDRARAVNGTKADAVDWIVAHGTGTRVGDDVELETLIGAAGTAGVLCTSNKPLIGHGAWAAGAINVIHALLAMRHGEIPAERYFTALPAGVPADRVTVPVEPVSWLASGDRNRLAGICAYGFGGTNAHLMVQAPDAGPDLPQSALPNPVGTQEDPMVLVGTSVHLPGAVTGTTIAEWLCAGAGAPARSFGAEYPLPPWPQLRMPPVSARSIDRTQLMALTAVDMFVSEWGEPWDGMRERTGVFTAHTGPTRCMADYTVRVGADELRAALADASGITAADRRRLEDELAALAQRLPAANEWSMTGQLTNIIASMIVNRYRCKGLAMNLDCGRSSTQGALHAAERYLVSGELDFALVIALNGHSTALMAALTGVPAEELAEGAVLLALTRKSVAARNGCPQRAVIRTDAARSGRHTGVPGATGRCYLGADGAIAVLRALDTGHTGPVVLRNLDPGPRVEIETLPHAANTAAPLEHSTSTVHGAGTDSHKPRTPIQDHRAGPPEPCPRPQECLQQQPQPEPRVPLPYRSVVVLRRADTRLGAVCRPALTPTTLILTHRTDLAQQLEPLACATNSRVLCTDPAASATDYISVTNGAGPREAIETTVATMHSGIGHVLIVASARGQQSRWPLAPSPELLSLQECALAAAAALGKRQVLDGSVTALLLDPLRRAMIHPHLTLITGLLRSLAHEISGTVYAVVTDATLGAGLDQLGDEAAAARETTVVHYRQGLRYVEQLCPAPLPGQRRTGPLPWTSSPVIVATGGARGATAVAVTALAERVRPVLWLLGTTPADDVPTDLVNAPDGELTAKRAEFLSHERELDPTATIIALNKRFDALLRAREIRRTLRTLELLCGTDNVHYLVCDLREREQVMHAAEAVYARHRRVDLLIHGAGRIRSAAAIDKSLTDFREIRDIKVAGYHFLKEAFTDPPPALWCNFGSANALLGSAGDTDYVAANEYLCAAAQYGDCTEFTPAWGLWTDTGMVRDIAAQLSREYGLAGISNGQGADLLLSELALPRPLDPVPFYGIPNSRARQPDLVDPLLGAPDAARDGMGTWTWRPHSVRDSYLAEHLIDRRPVVPAVMMLAMAAEAALRLHPGPHVTGFRDFCIDAPLFTDRRTAGCRVTAETVVPGTIRVEVRSDVVAPDGRILVYDYRHCRVDVHLGTLPRHNRRQRRAKCLHCPTIQRSGPMCPPSFPGSGARSTSRPQTQPAPRPGACHIPTPTAFSRGCRFQHCCSIPHCGFSATPTARWQPDHGRPACRRPHRPPHRRLRCRSHRTISGWPTPVLRRRSAPGSRGHRRRPHRAGRNRPCHPHRRHRSV